MIVTLAGHVDHGKTAVVQALTGTNTDRLKEEQERGLTIDLGFAYANLGDQRVGFVDVPGHTRFIHNMIAGVANQQHALLIIAAEDGIMPQTIEHVQILELLGVQTGSIVINKIDLVESSDLALLRNSIGEFANGTFLKHAPIFEVSTTKQLGLESLRQHLIETARSFKQRYSEQAFRMAVDRAFGLHGVGTIVTGTVVSGSVEKGDSLHLTTSGESVRVRSVNVQGEATDNAVFGDRCSLNITGERVNLAKRGSWLCEEQSILAVDRVSVMASVLADFPRTLSNWSRIHVYHLTDHCEANLALLESKKIPPGSTELAQLHCRSAMHFKAGDKLLLRDEDLSRTFGGAVVIGTVPNNVKRSRSAKNVSVLKDLSDAVGHEEVVRSLELESSRSLVRETEFQAFWNLQPSRMAGLLQSGNVEHHHGLILNTEWFRELATLLLTNLSKFHELNPNLSGAPLSQLTSSIPQSVEITQFVLGLLVSRQQIGYSGGAYALSDHVVSKPEFDEQLYLTIKPLLDEQHPTSLGDISKRLRIPLVQLEKSVKPMVAANVLTQVAPNRYLTPDRMKRLTEQASELASIHPFTVKEFRDLSQLGRNLAIDVLEYFDRQRVTRRQGDFRVMVSSELRNR